MQKGEYASYDKPEDWLPELENRQLSAWILGQKILASHNEGRFRTHAAEGIVAADSTVRLRVEGITPLAPLAILSGRSNGEPLLGLFGKVIIPYEESLDALVRIPPDTESGTYVFFAQQWEPGGQSAYLGGFLIYPSSVASIEVRSLEDLEDLRAADEALREIERGEDELIPWEQVRDKIGSEYEGPGAP